MKRPVLKGGTEWIDIAVMDPLDMMLPSRGYVQLRGVRVTDNTEEMTMYMGACPIAEPPGKLRAANGGRFAGLQFRVRKTETDSRASYQWELLR